MWQNLRATIKRFIGEDSGPTAVEYAAALVLIITACITAIQLVGGVSSDSLDDSSSKIQQATNGS